MRNTGEFVNANGAREVCTVTREEWLAERAKTDEIHVVVPMRLTPGLTNE